MWLIYFVTQFVYVGLLGLQSKFNRDHKQKLLFINSFAISLLQIYVMKTIVTEGASIFEMMMFSLGGALGISLLTDLYEKTIKRG